MDARGVFDLREGHLSVPADQAWAHALLHWTQAAESELARRDAGALLVAEFSEAGRRLLLFTLLKRLTAAARPSLEAEVDERLRALGGLLAYDARLATREQRARAAEGVRAALEAEVAAGLVVPGVARGAHVLACAADVTSASRAPGPGSPQHAHAPACTANGADASDALRRLGPSEPSVEPGPLARMPLLAPVLDNLAGQFVDMALELAGRLARDRATLACTLFGGADPGRVVSVSADGADAHRAGRMALVLTFADGRRVLYKPRDCAVDTLFGGLVARWFADDLVVPRTLARDGYGWCEFVERAPVADEGEVRAYFRRLGRVFALAQALGSTDLHAENWLACGARPALVDLETVLAPVPRVFSDQTAHPDVLGSGRDAFLEDLNRSLVPSCLLPDSRGGAQLSVLLADGEGQACLPELGGRRVSVLGYENELLAGFSEGYGRCLEARDGLRAAVEGFSGATVRRLVRNTDYYARLLRRLHGRSALASRGERGRIVARTEDFFVRHGAADMLPIARFEATCLLRGDVPYFCARADGHDLCGDEAGEDGVVVPDFFERSAVESALERIDRLSEAERDFEMGILRESLRMALVHAPGAEGLGDGSEPGGDADASAPIRAESGELVARDARDVLAGGVALDKGGPLAEAGVHGHAHPAPDAPTPLSSEAALAEAIALFGDIEARLLTGPSGARGWIARNGEQGALAIAWPGLAQGTSGYGVLFAALSDAPGAPADVCRRARELAELCLDRLELTLEGLERARSIPEGAVSLGVTDGLGGVLLSLTHVGRHLRDGRAQGLATRLLALLGRTDIEGAKLTDVYAGLAGLVLGIDACVSLLADDEAGCDGSAVCAMRANGGASTSREASGAATTALFGARVEADGGTDGAYCAAGAAHVLRDARTAVRRAATRLLELRTLPDSTDGAPLLWDTLGKGHPIGGAAHGMAGVATALLAAAELTGDPALVDPALDALAFEHRTYSAQLGTWPDFRASTRPDAAMHGLCSGAPGEGLALLACRARLVWAASARTPADGPVARSLGPVLAALDEDIARAVDACLTRSPAPRDHLCCGNASSVELLLEAARLGGAAPTSPSFVGTSLRAERDLHAATPAPSPAPAMPPVPTRGSGDTGAAVSRSLPSFSPDLAQRCRSRAAGLLAIGRARGWRLLPAGYRDVPDMSLLYGRAGIAYELLRFADPTLPPVLF